VRESEGGGERESKREKESKSGRKRETGTTFATKNMDAYVYSYAYMV